MDDGLGDDSPANDDEGSLADERRVDGVLFDFGGVIVDGPFEAFSALRSSSGPVGDAVRRVNSRNPDTNAWARIERGEIDADAFVALFEAEAAELGHDIDGRAVLDVVTGLDSSRAGARPRMLSVVERCRHAGVRTGLITNNVRPMRSSPRTAWVYEAFDVVVESCLAGVRKPEPAIYTAALDALGVAAGATVMLDDLGINLKPARALGIHTIKVVDAAAAADEVEQLLAAAGR